MLLSASPFGVPAARIELLVHGRVQGVAYRAWTRREALALGLRGYARNRPDGTVEVVAEGEAAALEALAERCREGPPLARVRAVDVVRAAPRGVPAGFDVL